MKWFWLVAAVACGPLGPREVTGPPAPAAAPAVPARIVISEPYPPGSHLVFVDERGRRVADLTERTAERNLDITPSWSRDGRWIAFASSRGHPRPDEMSLWIVAADRTSPPRRLTDDAGVDFSPSFSPDGRRLVFASTRGGAGIDLWILELDGNRLRQLTHGDDQEYAPFWSHRGDLIAYTHAAGPGEQRVEVIAPDGSGARVVTTGAQPAFSPDDRTIVFLAAAEGRRAKDLWLVATDGSNRRRLTDDPVGDQWGPRFDASGRFILASSLVRDDAGKAIFSTLVFVDLDEHPAQLRALVDTFPTARLGVEVAPQPLDAALLRQNPTQVEALRRYLLR